MRTIALKYLDGFSCIGAECEDDCCSGWAVPVDETHYRAIEAKVGPEELSQKLSRQPEGERQRFALMVLDQDRHCAMLGDDRLCTLHKRFGEEVIPDTCAVFPRSSGVVGGRFELTASISCPEIARRCLLQEGSTDPIEVSDDKIVRGLIYKAVRGDEGPYQASFESVRGLLMGVLSQRRVPLAARLCALAWFSEQTRRWLHKDAESVDREVISRLFQLMSQPATLDQFQQQMQSARMTEPFAASVVQQVLVASREDPSPTFLRIVDQALARDGESDPRKLWTAHQQRVANLPAAAAEKLERALEAYCKNFAFKDWYLKSPSFNRWLHGLLVRVAILRYLIIAHPAAPELAIVETAYSLSRTYEHDDRAMSRILDALDSQGMQTLGHAVALLTF